eukprot:gene7362-7573_t
MQLAWHLGRVGVPLACAALAASRPDVLHGVYLLAMLLAFLSTCVGLEPLPPVVPLWFQQALPTSSSICSIACSQPQQQPHALPCAHLPQHRLLRFYGSCHLLVVYLALVMQLPGLQSDFNEYVLKLVGLWDPKILSDLVPVLLLLVAATVHVTVGKWLMTRPPAGTGPGSQAVARTADGDAAAAVQAAASPDSQAGGPHCPDSQAGAASDCGDAGRKEYDAVLWLEAVHPRWLWLALSWCAKLAVSVGAALLVLTGYLLLLWDTPVGLLEIPEEETDDVAHEVSYGRRSRCNGCTNCNWRWLLPVLLALLLAADLTLQFVLVVGALVHDRPLLPPAVSSWIRDVVGIDDGATGRQLVAALFRPVRWVIRHCDLVVGVSCFAAAMQAPSALGLAFLCGVLITSLHYSFFGPSAAAAAAAAGRRCGPYTADRARGFSGRSSSSTTYSSVQSEFCSAAMASKGRPMDLFMDGCMVMLQLLAASWLIAVYVLQVAWVRQQLLAMLPPVVPWLLLWLGLPIAGPDPDQAEVQGHGRPEDPDSLEAANWEDLEPVLRRAEQLVSPVKALMLKLLYLISLITARVLSAMDLPEGAVHTVGFNILNADPPTLRRSSRSSRATPAAPQGLPGSSQATRAGWRHKVLWWLTAVSLGIQEFMSEFWQVVQYAALLGPWPTGPPTAPPGPPSPGPPPLSSQLNAAASPPAEPSDGSITNGSINGSWQLHASHLTANNSNSRTVDMQTLEFYRSVLYPTGYSILGALQVSEQSPQAPEPSANSSPVFSDACPGAAKDGDPASLPPLLVVWYWLGLQSVQPGVLWLLAAAVAVVLNVLQHLPEQDWHQPQEPTAATASAHQTAQAPAHQAQLQRESEGPAVAAGIGVAGQQSLLTAALQSAGSSSGSSTARSTTAQGHAAPQQHMLDHERQQPLEERLQLFQPMHYGCRGHWTWLDWCRFIVLKHALDIVLVCVALTCTMQKDLLHAGYLAIALVFFRRRYSLMTTPFQPPTASVTAGPAAAGSAGQSAGMATSLNISVSSTSGSTSNRNLFAWLPAFNYLVIAATLAYQAPLELLLGQGWSNTCQLGPGAVPRCSLPHLLGFCKLLAWSQTLNPTPAAAAATAPIAYSYSFAYGPFAGYSCASLLATSGALADLLLWVLLRLQHKLSGSKIYAQVVACIALEGRATAAEQQQQNRRWYDNQARSALATSRLRMARTLRINKLKASMLEEAAVQLLPFQGGSSSHLPAAAAAGGASTASSTFEYQQQLSLKSAKQSGPSRQFMHPGIQQGFDNQIFKPQYAAAGSVQELAAAQQEQQQLQAQEHGSAVLAAQSASILHGTPPRYVDYSLLMLVYVLGMLLVALLSQGRARSFWMVLLVYTEVLLIVQYSYLTAARCMCIVPPDSSSTLQQQQYRPPVDHLGLSSSSSCWRPSQMGSPSASTHCGIQAHDGGGGSLSPGGPGQCVWAIGGDPASIRHMLDVLGLHNTSGRILPLFLIYLATLMYNYSLGNGRQHGQLRGRGWTHQASGIVGGTADPVGSGGATRREAAVEGGSTGAVVLLLLSLQGWLQQLVLWVRRQLFRLNYHIRSVAFYHESPPSWLKLDLAAPAVGQPAWSSPAGAALLQQGFQQALDGLRSQDIAFASAVSSGRTPPPPGITNADSWQQQQQQHPALPMSLQQQHSAGDWSLRAPDQPSAQAAASLFDPSRATGAFPLVRPATACYEDTSVKDAHAGVELQTYSMSGQVGGTSPTSPKAEAAASGGAVLEVTAAPAWQPEQLAGLTALGNMSDTITNAELAGPVTVGRHPREPGGLSRITRLVLRLDRVLLKEDPGGLKPSGAAVALFEVLPQDLEVAMKSARTLADLTDEKQLPWDYLSALLVLFVITVIDRLVYSLGSHLGKYLLLLGQLLLFIPSCMSLFWAPVGIGSSGNAASGTTREHLRVFIVLKACSWVTTCLQLRSGFPPRASFDGGGRQRFVFYSRPDVWHLMGFYAFQAVPFLYELRALLDWTCSATPLNWYQWLKLEDIRASLFVEQCRSDWRQQRTIGERVPRYVKFLQGTLLFCLLLLAIWAPLLLFSSGAPTYQTPGIAEVHVNASLGVVTSYGHYQGVMSFPVFQVGSRRTVQNWASTEGDSSAGGGNPLRHNTPWPAAAPRRQHQRSTLSHQPQQGNPPAPAPLVPQHWLKVLGASGSNSSSEPAGLPPELAAYSPDQVKLLCLSQDSDVLWKLSPPARSALEVVLSEPSAHLRIGWKISRTAPLASGKGGPTCQGEVLVPLAGESRMQLLEVLRGERDSAQLMALNSSDPEGWAPGHAGSPGLYWLFWRLSGEACSIKTFMGADTGGSSGPAGSDDGGDSSDMRSHLDKAVLLEGQKQQRKRHWHLGHALADGGPCATSVQDTNGSIWPGTRRTADRQTARAAQAAGRQRKVIGAGDEEVAAQQHQHLTLQQVAAAAGRNHRHLDWAHLQVGCNVSIAGNESDNGQWWQIHCQVLDTSSPVQVSGSGGTDDWVAVQGPLLVVVLERVQSGLLGAALSAFGITGLYFSVVFGIGRFLRLTVSNIRLRIAYEDFPSTKRLVALVQDIYIARAEGELQLEEELFYVLLKIYKTPQLLNELTRLPQPAMQQVQLL